MSRRARAIAFGAAALACAGLAAAMASGYRSDLTAQLGPLRPVLVAGRMLAAHRAITPAVAVPCGSSATGLPLSMQVIGRPFAEVDVLRVADAYQGLTGWHVRRPDMTATPAA